jgi:hypothetical protein
MAGMLALLCCTKFTWGTINEIWTVRQNLPAYTGKWPHAGYICCSCIANAERRCCEPSEIGQEGGMFGFRARPKVTSEFANLEIGS